MRSRGVKFALLPHLHLLIAYEIAQRVFPKNIGELHRLHSAAKSAFVKVAWLSSFHIFD
jgi:hypothetical protein